jgi:hypothetical protein
MALSGSFDFNPTTLEVIEGALRIVGAKQRGTTLEAEAYTEARDAFNMLLKQLNADGLRLWKIREATLFLDLEQESYSLGPSGDHAAYSFRQTTLSVAAASSASTVTVTTVTGIADNDYIGIELTDGSMHWTQVNGAPAGSVVTIDTALTGAAALGNIVYTYTTKINRPLRIVSARRRDSSSNDKTLTQISRQEYFDISDKSSAGDINQYYYDPQITNGVLYVWNTINDVANTLKLSVYDPVNDLDDTDNNIDVPVEWMRPLKIMLAQDLMLEHPVSDSRAKWIGMMAAEAKDVVMGWDVEPVSVFMAADNA